MLKGDKVILRSVLKADLPILQEIHSHPEILRYIDSRGDISLSIFEAKLTAQHESKDRNGEWLTIVAADDRIAGSIKYSSGRGSTIALIQELYIGRQYQTLGYATDAIRRVSKYLIEEREKKRLEVLIREDNTAALKAFEKAGYIREGIRRSSAFSGGKYRNEIFLSKLARDTFI